MVNNETPFKWRGRYNEDTDICLQALAADWCTVLINAFTVDKSRTMLMKGGNTDALEYHDDGRVKMARSLERMWPGVVTTKSRFGRPQHVVKNSWMKFTTPLKRREDIDWDNMEQNEFGLSLKQVGEKVKSKRLRKLLKANRDGK